MRLVCLHGWSGAAQHMHPLAHALQLKLGQQVSTLDLGQYSSLDDALTFDDLATAMMQAWQSHGLPLQPKSVDVVVYSMGALVLRHWLRRYFTPDTIPIRRCVMLAPANFGSVLAHKGRALLGRLFKGLHADRPFEVGSHLLRGLELGSPWSWDQALQDCFKAPVFTASHMLTTVLIGSEGNEGLSALVNEPGSDGVVRWAAADLEPVYYQVDFTQHPVCVTCQQSGNCTAYRVIPGCNHHRILSTEGGVNPQVLSAIVDGLSVTSDTFSAWRMVCQKHTMQCLKSVLTPNAFQHCVMRVRNQYGHAIEDYCVIMCEQQSDQHVLTEYFQSDVQKDCHVYSGDSSFRALYWNLSAFWRAPMPWKSLHIGVVAEPQFAPPVGEVGYAAYDDAHQPSWVLDLRGIQALMVPQRTSLIEVTLPRQHRGVFEFQRF